MSAGIHFILRYYIIRKYLAHIIFKETEIERWWKKMTGVYGLARCVIVRKSVFIAGRGRVKFSKRK